MNVANLYKKYYACIIYCYLLNSFLKCFINRVFRIFTNNIYYLSCINRYKLMTISKA